MYKSKTLSKKLTLYVKALTEYAESLESDMHDIQFDCMSLRDYVGELELKNMELELELSELQAVCREHDITLPDRYSESDRHPGIPLCNAQDEELPFL